MDTINCLREPSALYKNIMHSFHILTFPIYLATLIFLIKEPSKAFQTYKYYIIVHMLINILSEILVSYLILPDTYLPYLILRMTGLLAHWGFSGVVQFFSMAQFAIWTGGSILEMFYYRFKICVIHHQSSTYAKFLKFKVNLARFLSTLHPLVVIFTLKQTLEEEEIGRWKLYNSNPTVISLEVTCYNVMIANVDSLILWTLLPIYIILMFTCALGAGGTLLYITNFIKKSVVMSKATEKLQKMLIFSLVIQGGVHLFMILVPVIYLMYGFFFELTWDRLARCFIVAFACHGFFSTVAMILFTKPLRDKMLPCFKNMKTGKSEPISTVPASITVNQGGC